MTKDPGTGDHISGVVSGSVQGQVVIGKNVVQHQDVGSMAMGLSDADRAELNDVFAKLREQVAAAPPEPQRAGALERIGELQEAVVAKELDLTTIQYVKQWFARNVPVAAGSVASVLVHPLIGQLVERAGNEIA